MLTIMYAVVQGSSIPCPSAGPQHVGRLAMPALGLGLEAGALVALSPDLAPNDRCGRVQGCTCAVHPTVPAGP